MAFYSPLRYPGGKGKLIPYIKQLIQENSLLDCTYVEPYAGGASVALSLLLDGYASEIIINDIDHSIFAFWHSVLNETEELCELIQKTPVTLKVWKRQKKKQQSGAGGSLLELGFSTFFLNRTNHSGILRAGVIGGYKQEGKWKIDARYNKENLIDRIKRISRYKNQIRLYNSDASVLMNSLRNTLPKNTLFYFDPPYYVKGKELYLNHYSEMDHKKISDDIKKIITQKWLLTYDNVEPIKKLYSRYGQRIYNLHYSAGKAGIGQELMVFSDNLSSVETPMLA